MTRVNARQYHNENYKKVVELAVGPLGQSRKVAEKVISWVQTVEYAEVFVAEVEGEVVGFIEMEYPPREDWAKIAYIAWIAVEDEHRRKGYGSRLIQVGEESARRRGMRRLYVEPTAREDYAICFYVTNGLMPEGRRIGYYPDSIILGKSLWRNHPDKPS